MFSSAKHSPSFEDRRVEVERQELQDMLSVNLAYRDPRGSLDLSEFF